MRCCNNNNRFVNEQTYLNTICNKGKPCAKPPRKRDCNYVEFTSCSPCGKLTLHCDKHRMGVYIDINKPDR